MQFTKMNGLGNDFIVVHGEQALPDQVSQLAIETCNRFFGIGADGLVYILPSERADFKMRIINSDGTEAEQCGNAIRCVAKYVADRGYVTSDELTIETIGAGVQRVQLNTDNGIVQSVRVDMGSPILDGLQIPTTIDAKPVVNMPVEVAGHTFHFTAVSMGNPHCVIYVEDATTFDVQQWGPVLERHPLFPRKINVEFASVQRRDFVDMRVWERGAGPTLACGTGACATLVASVLNGKTEREATISLAGGDLFIEWNEQDNHVYMTGPAEIVFTGQWVKGNL
ncbi:diaminopimelate epimerase [Paenibacillus sp. ACRRX]|uniref:diaminopimelate epimerase n=1 Tax=unclassified Paenibacillus TaxID=185978 RepID=UPI001EF665C2|nr:MULTISPECIES: diaminopimelate epimerase [unclassified Paenibacillus]MCG7407611.1 diaminopimelate epimerase [Paenibacillus sp. ACRRX]MDK8180846.1 diaminopimelate epimerase [Paenibacillus sp. UMB4589-SE434]